VLLYIAKGGVDTELKAIFPLFVFPSQVKKDHTNSVTLTEIELR